ncbi:MAG: DUF2933 domain-containing protein [Ectobacillus sp.]
MQWLNVLLFLLCPLMMLFCMKGMHGGHKHQKGSCCGQKHNGHSSDSISSLQAKIEELSNENNKMMKEIQALKQINES